MKLIIVWNSKQSNICAFYSLDSYQEYAKNGGYGDDWDVWCDEVYEVNEGENIFYGEPLDLQDFKINLTS